MITETKPNNTEVSQPKPEAVVVVVPKAAPTGGLVNLVEYRAKKVIVAPKSKGKINVPFLAFFSFFQPIRKLFLRGL